MTDRQYYEMFTDCWRFFKHAKPEKNGWDTIIQQAERINMTYESKFCSRLLVAILDEISQKENEK